MFRRLLIANRGEIAIRVARTARSLGIRCIGAYSDADVDALHRRAMDDSVRIGGPLPAESYLNIDNLVRAAHETGADAIHPGYGFLSESSAFATRCEEEGIIFIGPPPAAMALSGDKIGARKAMRQAGLPVTDGIDRALHSVDEAREVVREIGYPVIIKATAGGGGIGMSRVDRPSELGAAFESSQIVARTNFGNPDLFLEKYLPRTRHVEVQVLMDRRSGIGFVERECSVQRRHQKLVEETPSPAVGSRLRSQLIEVAVRGMRAIGYRNAGTVEFLLRDGKFMFNEVNARLQVEHPITEAVTGVDLVREQLQIAAGEELDLPRRGSSYRGHAIECRVNAEDPVRNFLPSPGRVVGYREPTGLGVRVDSGIRAGSVVPPYYDPLLAKLIVRGSSRAVAVRRMQRAVEAFEIGGLHTTLPFHRVLLRRTEFARGSLWTTMVADLRITESIRSRGPREERIAAIAAALVAGGRTKTGPTLNFERRRVAGWTLAGRREQLGGGHAAPARRRW